MRQRAFLNRCSTISRFLVWKLSTVELLDIWFIQLVLQFIVWLVLQLKAIKCAACRPLKASTVVCFPLSFSITAFQYIIFDY